MGAGGIRQSMREIATQPVFLWILLGGKPKWRPLNFGFNDAMRLVFLPDGARTERNVEVQYSCLSILSTNHVDVGSVTIFSDFLRFFARGKNGDCSRKCRGHHTMTARSAARTASPAKLSREKVVFLEQLSFSAALSCGRHYFSPHKMAAKNHRLS